MKAEGVDSVKNINTFALNQPGRVKDPDESAQIRMAPYPGYIRDVEGYLEHMTIDHLSELRREIEDPITGRYDNTGGGLVFC